MPWDPLVNMCLERPRFAQMERAYDDYFADRAPCKTGVTNQCAVRMSVAMVRCGLDFMGFPNQRRVHRGRTVCQLEHDHVLGARELADYLRRLLPEPQRLTQSVNSRPRAALANRKGIIYFDNCFTREPGGPQTGDHIDLWNGSNYYNELLRVSAGGNASASTDLFRRAGFVWFFELD